MAPVVALMTSTVAFLSTLISLASAVHVQNNTMTSSQASSSSLTAAASASPVANSSVALDPNATNCFLAIPDDAVSAMGLSTPFLLQPPCSQAVGTQQAFAEAAIFDPATGDITIYHPLIIDAAKTPQVAPVVPKLPAGASVALWFGFNGDTLTLQDMRGKDTNSSPQLQAIKCVNGLPGVKDDIFGQVSWCNTDAFFTPVNAAIASGLTTVPPLGTDKNGLDCPSSRAFTIVDQDPSDNLPTEYLLLADGSTVQNTAANRAKFPDATVINNASDEALLGDIIDPLIGCTPFKVQSVDDPGNLVSSLATQELQAGLFQKAPLGLVPLNDPDCLLTADGSVSTAKTNAYRVGVNQPALGTAADTNDGDLLSFCNNMIEFFPPWAVANQADFTAAATPDDTIGSNLFNFMCNRYLQSFVNLVCPPNNTQPVSCTLDVNGVATACTIKLQGNSTTPAGGKGGVSSVTSGTSAASISTSLSLGAENHNSSRTAAPTTIGTVPSSSGVSATFTRPSVSIISPGNSNAATSSSTGGGEFFPSSAPFTTASWPTMSSAVGAGSTAPSSSPSGGEFFPSYASTTPSVISPMTTPASPITSAAATATSSTYDLSSSYPWSFPQFSPGQGGGWSWGVSEASPTFFTATVLSATAGSSALAVSQYPTTFATVPVSVSISTVYVTVSANCRPTPWWEWNW